MGVDKDRYIT